MPIRFLRRPKGALPLAAAAAALAALLGGARGALAFTKAVAFVPFENSSSDRELASFSEELAKQASLEAANNKFLRVLGPGQTTPALTKAGTRSGGMVSLQTARSVGQALQADFVVFGEFQKVGDQVRISTHLLKVSSGEVVDDVKVTGRVADIFSLQDKVTRQAVEMARRAVSGAPPLSRAGSAPSVAVKPPAPKAKAPAGGFSAEEERRATRDLVRQQTGGEPPTQAKGSSFKDQENAATVALLHQAECSTADCWFNKGARLGNNSDEEAGYYRKAVETDPCYADAYYNLANVLLKQTKKDEGVAMLRRYLVFTRDEASREKVRQYLQSVDPRSSPPPVTPAAMSQARDLYMKGVALSNDSDVELGYYRQAVALNPAFAPAYKAIGTVHFDRTNYADAVLALEDYLKYAKIPPETLEQVAEARKLEDQARAALCKGK